MSEVIVGPHWIDYVKIDAKGNRSIPDDAPQWAKDDFEEDKKKRTVEWMRENLKVE